MSPHKNIYSLILLLLLSGVINHAVAQNRNFFIQVTDNASQLNNTVDYFVTNDSLIVTGFGDYGRTPVNYLRRALTSGESLKIHSFLTGFPIDSLDDLYQHPFNPGDYDGKNFYPRITEVTVGFGTNERSYRAINCWVRYSDLIFNALNPMLPAEVRIKHDSSKFEKHY